MAGESPDKAEQGESQDPRLSVVENTEDRGGEGAVHVTRVDHVDQAEADRVDREDREDREDRVDRENRADHADQDEADHADRVDQKTAVFRAPTPRTAPEDEPSDPRDPREAGEAGERREAPGATGVTGKAGKASEGASGAADGPETTVAADGAGAGTDARGENAAEPADGPSEPVEPVGPGKAPEAAKAASEGARKPTWAAETAVRAEAESKSESESESESEPTAEPAPGPKPEASEKPGTGESWFAVRKPVQSETAPEPESQPESKPAPEAAAVSVPAPASAPEAGNKPAPADEPVDHPTTVFKAIKPQPVDQPTTALKLPPASTFRPLQGDITQEQPKPSREQREQREPKGAKTVPAPAQAKAPASVPAQAGAGDFTAPVPVPASLVEPERTRQQPLPPRPPLEILAELTNTPPPPDTALRTTARRVKIWTPLVLLLLIVFAVAQFVRPLPAPRIVLSAEPSYTFEGGELKLPWPGEGQGAVEVEGVGSMGTYGPQKPAPIASVAKTMTAYVILRDHPIKGDGEGPRIKVDKIAAEQAKSPDESTAPIQEGQSFTEKELIELLMIPSGNNVARLLARWDAGSESAFIDKMNAAAKDLGMTGSTYTDPSGLKSSTVSTPLDQLKLAKAVMQYEVFREVVDMPNVTVDGIPNRIENNNTILLKPGVAGIKTGSSTPAGGNLLWAAYTVVDGEKRRILGIVMGAQDAQILADKLDLAITNSYTVIKEAQDVVTSATVVKKGQVLGYVDDGFDGRTPVVATKDIKAVGWPGLKVGLKLGAGDKDLPHAGKAGDIVGVVAVGTGPGAAPVTAPVALQTDMAQPGIGKKLTRLG
ncbi:D-alanyl-D-alanine carboxypeptidase [Streptomyces sp. NPDC048718]|uniref:D-alanyl-D-alanine carboxypeptidase n=1 Tax=Streptomyces sp. NPDC048718 TaxID=3365587 RepID=UPI00371843AF